MLDQHRTTLMRVPSRPSPSCISIAHLKAVVEVHAKKGGRHDAGGQRKRANCHEQVDADNAVARGRQVHAPHLPDHLQVLSHFLAGQVVSPQDQPNLEASAKEGLCPGTDTDSRKQVHPP